MTMNKNISKNQENFELCFSTSHKPSFSRLISSLLLLGIVVLYALICWRAYRELPNPMDEFIILNRASWFLRGHSFPLAQYPPFPYLFYGFFLFLAHGISTHILLVGRVVNLCLLLLNLFLFFRVSLPHTGRNWALFSVFLFASTPLVVFSGVFVKTEGMILSEVLALMLCLGLLNEEKAKTWATIFSGVLCAVGITTKYSLMLPIMYILLTGYLYVVKKREKRIFFRYSLFVAAFIITFILIWPNFVDQIYNWHSANYNDDYFARGPSVLRAVDEPWAFPYGKYSYALCLIIPFSLGPLVFILSLLSLRGRKTPPLVPAVAYVSFFLGFMIVANVTLVRYFWVFTLLAPPAVLLSVIKLRALFNSNSIWNRRIAAFLIAIMVSVQGVSTPAPRSRSHRWVDH